MMDKAIAIMQIISAFALISYWVIFFLTEFKKRTMSEARFRYELAFPLPDLGWIAVNSVVATVGLLSNRNYGYFFSALAGSGMLFLSFIDLSYNLQNKGFSVKEHPFNAYLEMVIVIGWLAFGSLFIVHAAVNLLK